jgi:hypothetical protein
LTCFEKYVMVNFNRKQKILIYFLCPISNIQYPISNIQYPISNIQYPL